MAAPAFAGPTRERIVVLTTSYPAFSGDASGHFVETEVNELRASGHDVIVIAPWPRDGAQGEHDARWFDAAPDGAQRERGVRWLDGGGAFGAPGVLARLRERPARLAGVARFLRAVLRELDALGEADRLVAHFVVPSAFPLLAWSRVRARRVEVVAHGSDARLLARLPSRVRRHVAHNLARRNVTLRCTSEELRALLEDALGPAFHGAIRVEASPISVAGTPTRVTARARLGIAQDATLVVLVARLVAGKRVGVALRAATLLPSSPTVVVVGDGPLRRALEREFSRVTFVGQLERSRALAFIAAADVVLSASRLEGSPTVVREARLLGTRVVALRAGDLGERYAGDPDVIVVEP